MIDKRAIDGTKLQYHPIEVAKVLQADSWEKAKDCYPIYIEVSPYNGCNHDCSFCGIDYFRSKDSHVDADIYAERIKEISELGVQAVMFAGEGEPLLTKYTSLMIKSTKEVGIGVGLTTNGVPMTNRFVDESIGYIDWIKVSFNAGSKATYAQVHRCKDRDYDIVLENIRYAVANKGNCDVGMQMVLLADNADECLLFADLARDTGVSYAVIKKYSQQLFSNTKIHKDTDYSKYLFLESELKARSSNDFSVVFRSNSFAEHNPYDTCMSTPNLWAYIDAKMNVWACSAYLGQERFNLGNLEDQTFVQIWHGEKRRKLFEEGIDIKGCRSNCRMDSCNRYLLNCATGVKNGGFI